MKKNSDAEGIYSGHFEHRSNTKYEFGEVIDVYYKRETSYKVIAGDFQQMWFAVSAVGTAGLLFLFFGVRSNRREKAAKAS